MSQDDTLPEITPEEFELPTEQAGESAADEAPINIPLIEATRRAEENWEKLLRSQAELENLKRRSEKDLQNAHKFGLEKFARELLPVADSLELGLNVETSENPEAQKLREGMELTLKQLMSSLQKFNVEVVDPTGERFNPELHQAMAMQPTDDVEPNTVIKVFQKGYLLNERLLRPAMVVVAQAVQ
ncbi:MAG: nucleotide exchange factor GrpE [Methylococcaceae bacterium]|jgi:molecular chaperone GrpE